MFSEGLGRLLIGKMKKSYNRCIFNTVEPRLYGLQLCDFLTFATKFLVTDAFYYMEYHQLYDFLAFPTTDRPNWSVYDLVIVENDLIIVENDRM